MVANNYRFRKINFPAVLGPSIIFQGKTVIGTTAIPDGASNLDIATLNVDLEESSFIYATWNSSLQLQKDGGLTAPIEFTFALLHGVTQFSGSEGKILYASTDESWISISTSGINDTPLDAGSYTIRMRILTAVVDGAGAVLNIDPEGSLTVFSIPDSTL